MKQRLLLPLVVFFSSVLILFACRRSVITAQPAPPLNSTNQPVTATGVFVAQSGCTYVVKVLSGSIPDSSVVKSWTDTQNDSTFTNVFTVKDGPAIQLAQVAIGDTFTFTFNGPVPDSVSTIASCDILTTNVPGVYNNVTDIRLQH
jgi:hypothetical protein